MNDHDDEMQEIDYAEDEFSDDFSHLTTESGDLLDDSNPWDYPDMDDFDDDTDDDEQDNDA